MQRNVVEFIAILRRKGLRISISESIDSVNAIMNSDISSKQQFRNAVRCTLIKNSEDFETFNRIFNIYFTHFSLDDLDEMEELEEEAFQKRIEEMEKSFNEKKFEEELEEMEEVFEEEEEKEKKEELGVEELRDDEKDNSEEVHGGDDVHGDIQNHERDSDSDDGGNDFEAEIDSLFTDKKEECEKREDKEEAQERDTQDSESPKGSSETNQNTNSQTPQDSEAQTTETTKQKLRDALERGDFSNIKDIISESAKKQAEKESKEKYQKHQAENVHFSSEFTKELNQAITGINEELRKNFDSEEERGDAEADRIQKNINELRRRYNDAVDEELMKRYGMELLEEEEENLTEKDFSAYTEKDYAQVRKQVQKIAKKIHGIVSRKQKQSKRGRIDIRRTIRASLQHGGTPMNLKHRNKKHNKPDLVMLCDLSGSVSFFSEFMLTIMKALEDKVSKFEAYAFVDTTSQLDLTNTINEALQKAEGEVSLQGYSDFGNSFMEFYDNHLDCVDKKTTVIILGDARNNGKNSQAWTLQEIQRKAKSLIWLNPEQKEEWNTGDSIMTEYTQFCDEAFQCSNLQDIEKLSKRICVR